MTGSLLNSCRDDYVLPLSRIKTYLESIEKARNTIEYAEKIGGKTAVIEFDYVDKDYLLDYVGYYSRSFQEVGRYTTRIHIFSSEMDTTRFERIINTNYIEDIDNLKKCYVGFFIVKQRTPLQAAGHVRAV